MHLRSLKISGFKSFPEAKLEFPRGITAVVGPNGSGKSNVVDALLWVLGEQSTKALRSEKMEDVIFNGTETKKPLGVAEVSLVVGDVSQQELEALSGLSDELPRSTELMITRRLYRDGGSEYSINTIPCRLKDIRGLLLEARAGTKGHTVIEQGNLDHILSATPQERRSIIEETAGIGRYKKQKTEALRKLNITENNLVRVRDIIAEVRRQLRSLDRQARQAQLYQTLQRDARSLEVQLLTSDYHALCTARTEAEGELRIFEEDESKTMAEEAGLMAKYEDAKSSLRTEGELADQLQRDLRSVEQELGQTLIAMEVQRNQLRICQNQLSQTQEEQRRLEEESERAAQTLTEHQEQLARIDQERQRQTEALAEIEAREQDLSAKRTAALEDVERIRQSLLSSTIDKTHAENQLQSLTEQTDTLSARLTRLRDEQRDYEQQRVTVSDQLQQQQDKRQHIWEALEESRRSHQETEQHREKLEKQIRELEQQLITNRTDQAAAESRRHALQAVLQEEFGYGREGEDRLPGIRQQCQGILEAIGERLEVPQEYEIAIEAVLGEKIRAWVVNDIADGKEAIAFLKEQQLGRGTFLPIGESNRNEANNSPWWHTIRDREGVIGRAGDVVRCPEELMPTLSAILDSIVIVTTFDVGVQLLNQLHQTQGSNPIIVTRDGEVFDPLGMITGGWAGDSLGLLQRRREVRALDQHIHVLSEDRQHLERTQDMHQDTLESLKTRLLALNESIRDWDGQWQQSDREVTRLERVLEDLDTHCHTLSAEFASSQEDFQRLQENLQSAQSKLLTLQQAETEQRKALDTANLARETLEAEYATLQASLAEARLQDATIRERRDYFERDLTRFRQEEEHRRHRVTALEHTLTQFTRDIQTTQEEQARTESAFQELEIKKNTLQTALTTAEEQRDERLQTLRNLEQALADIRKTFSSTREKRGAVEIRLAEIRTRLEAVEATLTGTYSLSLDDLMPQDTPESDQGAITDQQSEDDVRTRLQDIRQRMERMGAINLAAIEEHRELEERYEFLSKQEEDLSGSIQSLQEIIERLNRSTNKMFQETFQALQEKFNEVFSALFAGGKAELVLVEPEADEGTPSREEPGVDIIAQPPGKRLKNLAMLSGGEKTLTVMALMFASFLIRPSPFCILDEVDAPLDESNVVRFAKFLEQMADQSQFIVITHNKRTMEVADSLFGVTMEEPGISKFVSVRLLEAQQV